LLNDVIFFCFSDKKLFALATPKYSQNDLLYLSAATRNKDVKAERFFSQEHVQSVADDDRRHIEVDSAFKVDETFKPGTR